MSANFSFLVEQKAYALFAPACVEAERVLATSPAMCAVGCRKALELAVKWVYAADNTVTMPYKDNLQSLIHEPSFRYAVDGRVWGRLQVVIQLGNLAVHTEKKVERGDAVLSLSVLFDFVEWIDYCYGGAYEERTFSEARIPAEKVVVDEAKAKEQQSLLAQKDSELEALRKQVEQMSARLTAEKPRNAETRVFTPEDLSEFATRKRYIDIELKSLGWTFGGDVREEVEVPDMAGVPGQPGFADYVLYGRDDLPLAVVEAKRTSKDPNVGRQQAKLYADSIEKRCGRRPMIFTTNGFETYFWDDHSAPQRRVSSIFSQSDLQKLMNRREQRKNLDDVKIDDRITDRYYQKEAIRAVSDNIRQGHSRSLLVMATGTGKTRTAASLTDVLSRGGYITNVLFLADRTALVRQAKDSFRACLPDMSLCNLLSNKDDKDARIVFSTYPTMLNAIDSAKSADGQRLFTPAHFDLIIVDEAHRSIFKKYRAIFAYFDALIVGLTATPKTDVDRNTYDFFEMEHGVPTYAYDYETAVYKDRVLVPYYNIETKLKFLEQGIAYDELSEADKQRYEEDFTDEDGDMPDFIPSPQINEFIFNQSTVDTALQDLMTKGIRVAGGDRLGKTIIFAQNKKHAQYIAERFDALYPQYRGGFIRRIVCDDSYAQTLIDDFSQPEKDPHIAVSVDMMDTGIDVPEAVNLVFFKKVCSKTKFWQMIGRGTRLCKGLACIDSKDGAYTDKRRFYIFDYMGNFEFFRTNRQGLEAKETQSLSEAIFAKRVRLTYHFQESAFAKPPFLEWRAELVEILAAQVRALNPELVSVRLHRRAVEQFKQTETFACLTEQDKHDLIAGLAPLVYMDDADEYAKRFDNFLYGIMLAQIEALPAFKSSKRELCALAVALEQRSSIPQIKEKLPLIHRIGTDDFWAEAGPAVFETVRNELRDLVKFLVDTGTGQRPIFTSLTDEVLSVQEGQEVGPAYDFTDYRLKVNRYIEEHRDHIAIYKLRNNIRLTETDYQALSNILTKELGSEEDYKREYKDLPFGLLVRKVAKLDHEAAMKAFSIFINDQALNQQQIVFVKKVVDYVVQNGYMESPRMLMAPPFDKPQSFIRLFDGTRQQKLLNLINEIKANAVEVS